MHFMDKLPGVVAPQRLLLVSFLLLRLFSIAIHANDMQCSAEAKHPVELAARCSELIQTLKAHPHASERGVWGNIRRPKEFTTPLEWRTDYCIIMLRTTDFGDYYKNDIFSIDDDVVPMVKAVIQACILEGHYGGGIGKVGRRKIFSVQLFDAAVPAQKTRLSAWNSTLDTTET